MAQKGSNITAERLRFDFSFGRKVTKDELAQVEKMVNEAIQAKVPVVCEEMTVPEAKEKGAIGLFESKYGEKVRTYKMGDYSFEICGGPHAQNTGDLGTFKIQKEESSSAGVRRIKAVLIPRPEITRGAASGLQRVFDPLDSLSRDSVGDAFRLCPRVY